MSELNLAVTNAIISRHLKVDIECMNLRDLLPAIAIKLDWYEQKVLDLENKIAEKDKILARNLGLV